jgi:formylglycine-generating enzyme required for sulfatase activity
MTEDWDDGAYGPAMVGRYVANPFGLHDVHGNVCEWCSDWYAVFSGNREDPVREEGDSSFRVIRGGGLDMMAVWARSANRATGTPRFAASNLGLRPVRATRLSSSPLHH